MTQLEKKVAELEQETADVLTRIAEADSKLGRIEIRAPAAGVVHSMSGLAVGHEVRSGETVAEIVLPPGAIVLESRLTADEARDAVKGPVRIWRSLGSWRDGRVATGKLVAILPGRSGDHGQAPAYIARIEIDAAQADRLNGRPGEPEGALTVSIPQGSRRAIEPLQALLRPLRSLAWRALQTPHSKGA